MSVTKRVLLGGKPSRSSNDTEEVQETFPFRIASRRRSPKTSCQYWDPWWPICISKSAEALNIETIRINDGVFVRNQEQADKIKEAAEEMWRNVSWGQKT